MLCTSVFICVFVTLMVGSEGKMRREGVQDCGRISSRSLPTRTARAGLTHCLLTAYNFPFGPRSVCSSHLCILLPFFTPPGNLSWWEGCKNNSPASMGSMSCPCARAVARSPHAQLIGGPTGVPHSSATAVLALLTLGFLGYFGVSFENVSFNLFRLFFLL